MSTRRDANRLLLHVTCQSHEGSVGFTNLVVTRNNDTIMLNPHVDNSCVLTLDEVAAEVLHNALGEWLAISAHRRAGGSAAGRTAAQG